MEKLAYRYSSYQSNGGYTHPTIDIFILQDMERSIPSEVLSLKWQIDKENRTPYAMRAELKIDWNYHMETSVAILRDINKKHCAPFRGVLQYLKSKKAVRYIWDRSADAWIPARVRRHAHLYAQARKDGWNITRQAMI